MILLSARDPQAAEILASLYQACFSNTPSLVIAEYPATAILEREHIPFIAWKTRPHQRSRLSHLIDQLDTLLPSPRNIQWILTGLSGPGWGIDEILTCWGKQRNVPTFALQSWWGDVNVTLGCLPDAYIVRDATAARLTHRRLDSAVTTTLEPWPFPVIQSPAPLPCRKTCTQFYAQPIRPDLTCLAIIQLVKNIKGTIWVKLHPKTGTVQRAHLRGCIRRLRQKGYTIRLGESKCLCSVQTTLFSTTLERLAHQLGHKPPAKLPALWFIQTNPLIRSLTRQMTHMNQLPFEQPVYEVIQDLDLLNGKRRIPYFTLSATQKKALHRLSPRPEQLCDRLRKSIQRVLDARLDDSTRHP